MKTPRVYAELAAFAVSIGYPAVTEAAVQDWRKRELLPSARGLGRRSRAPGDLPAVLTEAVRAICHYHYDRKIKDLRFVGLLMWLDGRDIPLHAVRDGLADAVGGLVEKLLAMSGSRAARAAPDDPDADALAAARSASRHASELAEELGGTVDDWEALEEALFESFRLATDRSAQAEVDFSPLARAFAMDRATTDTRGDVGPWLDGDPGLEMVGANIDLFSPAARVEIRKLGDRELLASRDQANRLSEVLDVVAPMIEVAEPRGFAGFGVFPVLLRRFTEISGALLLYVAALQPDGVAEFVAEFPDDRLAEYRLAVDFGRNWLAEHPEMADEVRERGLTAILSPQVEDSK